MSLETYKIRCARHDEPVELTGQDALDHLKACGIQRKLVMHTVKARPWVAPKPTPGGLARVVERLDAGYYDLTPPLVPRRRHASRRSGMKNGGGSFARCPKCDRLILRGQDCTEECQERNGSTW